jgi:hypothetical protein
MCQVTATKLSPALPPGKGLTLSPQQAEALDEIDHWFRHSDDPLFELAGLAGTGKTELVVRLQHELRGTVQYCSLTGKAASLLRSRGAGSEWPHVVVIDETDTPGFRFITPKSLTPAEFKRRWLYTACTRAKMRVDIMQAPRLRP